MFSSCGSKSDEKSESLGGVGGAGGVSGLLNESPVTIPDSPVVFPPYFFADPGVLPAGVLVNEGIAGGGAR